MPRLQCKWIHGDSERQNLDRSTGMLVYGSFKIRQEPSGHLEPPPSKGCLPTEQSLDQPGCTSSLYLSWINDFPLSGSWPCLCISACSPYFHNLFDLVSGLHSHVSFSSETLEWWLLHSSCVLCNGDSTILRTPFQLTLTLRQSLSS